MNNEQRTMNNQNRIKIKKQGSKNREQRLKNKEQRTKNKEQRTKNKDFLHDTASQIQFCVFVLNTCFPFACHRLGRQNDI